MKDFAKCYEMDFFDLDKEQNDLIKDVHDLTDQINNQKKESGQTDSSIEDLTKRVNLLEEALGQSKTNFEQKSELYMSDDLNSILDASFPNDGVMTESDKRFNLHMWDYIVASIAGGIGIVLDFFVVKIPKSTISVRNGERFKQEGSSLTKFFRSIGSDENGEVNKWIRFLEEKCKVPYDKSINPLIKNMCPKNHRFFSLAHDSSPLGLIWGIRDIVNGTFSYIDGEGILHIEKIADGSSFIGALTAPIIWIGHIISDIFTKAGIPIPGWCYLHLLQFGNIGEKKRTIAEVARYMYMQGYDLRHLLTMSIEPAAIGLILHIYHFLVNVGPENEMNYTLQAEKEYSCIKNNIKFKRMSLVALSVASAGDIGKVIMYQGNPLAINYALWCSMIKEALLNAAIQIRDTKDYEKVIENRHVIDENFEAILNLIEKTDEMN